MSGRAIWEWAEDHAPYLIVTFGAVVVLWLSWWGVTAPTEWYRLHPCVREEQYACTHSVCIMHMPGTADRPGYCAAWNTTTDTCTRCAERADLTAEVER